MELLELALYHKGLREVEEKAMRRAEIDRVFGKKRELRRGFSLAQVREAVLQSLFPRLAVSH